MTFSNKENTDFLSNADATLVHIENNTAMLTRLQTRSYGAARIAAGTNKIAVARAGLRTHLEKRQEKLAASVKLQAKRQEVHDRCVSFGVSLRSHFRFEPDLLKEIGLDKRFGRKAADLIEQTVHMYNRSLNTPEILDRLGAEGIEETMLQSDLALVGEYENQCRDFVRLKGECQELLEKRDQDIREAKAWMTGLKITLRALYKSNPQALESVGIMVLNTPRKKKAVDTSGDTGNNTTGTTNGNGDDSGTHSDTGGDNGTDIGIIVPDAGTTDETSIGAENGRKTAEIDSDTSTGGDSGTTVENVPVVPQPDTPVNNGRETADRISLNMFLNKQKEPEPAEMKENSSQDSITCKNQIKRKKKKNRR